MAFSFPVHLGRRFDVSVQLAGAGRGVTRWMLGAACFFAMQSAVFSVLLEWFFPIRSWRIESDLWHHPRKYAVPTVMLLLAGAVGTAPESLVPLMLLLGVEITGLLLWGRRY